MSDQGAAPILSSLPPAPSGARPKTTNRGRSTVPVSTLNSESSDMPEFEPFEAPGPRGFPPMTEFLDVWEVDMMRRPSESNKQQHHTMLFNSNHLLVRRGQEFQIKVVFNRPYDPATDLFAVEFVIGSSPDYSQGTHIPVFTTKERQSSWEGRVTDTVGSAVTVGITPLASCIVGKYQVYVAVKTPHGIRRTRRDPGRDVYILFNPWVPEDAVFLDDEAERQECVMTEIGIIYHGTNDDVAERNWNYGQFNYGVLDACLYILDRADMPITSRGDPVRVTRMASAMLNSRDDDGVLVGNWGGDYSDGVAPSSWTGSTEILLAYASSQKPVLYAQCWVYAAVFNTFLRCLGIPSRLVTNYFSAHDNDGNLKLDIILDKNGGIDRRRTKDTIWNYHCWNECYMSRPDLPAGFGGWQVVDATPQETSDGLYRCGPASVHAIKHGHLCFPFDGPFVFAEVNSDVLFYNRNKDSTLELVKVNKTHIGRMVLTKAPGEMTSRDITDQYKFPEGSDEDRTAMERAEELGCRREKADLPAGDVDLVLPNLEVNVGDSFELSLEFVNRSGQQRTVDIYISGTVVFYTGVISSEFVSRNPIVTIGPNSSVKESVTVESRKYMNSLVEQANLQFTATGKVKETGQVLSAVRIVTLHNPKLSVTVSAGGKVNEEMTVVVEFTNPFDYDLEGVYIRMEGPGIMLPMSKYYSLIPGNSSLTWSEIFVPRRAGSTRVIASLDCKALRQVNGVASVTVEP